MKKLLLIAILFSLNAFAFETDFSGNIEGQMRQVKNNDEAKEAPLFQDWSNENFYLLYGNLNGKIEFDESRIEGNWFVRYSQSDLYNPKPIGTTERQPYFATRIYTFPNQMVARDLFKLQYIDQSGNHQTESVLNKLYYERNLGQHRLMFGRIYINYGLGEIFNPLNPFNQPTALTSISQVAQGNDGASFTYFLNDHHNIQFLLLGDKRIEGYNGTIDTTFWAHGEYQYNDKLQLDYVLGEDQNRRKLGGGVSYQLEEAMIFTQLLYQTHTLKDEPSNNLWDALLGYDQQMTNKWHVRFEGGYQKKNRFISPERLERFLPTEYFLALANVYEFHPLVKGSATLINDIKSGFSYFIAKGTYSVTKSTELEVFGFTPVSKGDEPDNVAQRLVTTDVGLALRAFF